MGIPNYSNTKRSISVIIYLYKKTHNKTGLQYLGKTVKDPYKYKGSGKDWIPHIKEHGNDVTTEVLRECQTNQELSYWGRYYSTLWNVAESENWANRIPETGGGGNAGKSYDELYGPERAEELRESRRKSNSTRKLSQETLLQMSVSGKGKRCGDKNGMFNKTHSANTLAFLREHSRDKWTPEMRNTLAKAHSKGTYITPWGMFISASTAAKDPNSTIKDPGTLAGYCVNNDKPIKRFGGATGNELGFSFIPK